MDHAFFESTLTDVWDMAPVDRSFDPNKVQEYLAKLEEADSSFIRELLNKTMYISYVEFKQSLLQSFELFRREIAGDEFSLMLPVDRIGSEHWLTALLWPELRTMNVKSHSRDILIIDDAIYCGIRTVETIGKIIKVADRNMHFHLVIPYVTEGGSEYVMATCKGNNMRCTIYNIHRCLPLNTLMDIGKYYPNPRPDSTAPEDYYEDYLVILLYQKFGILGLDNPAIYFDHKVANNRSTFASIYLQGRLPDGSSYGSLFKVDPSREKIEELSKYVNK